MRGRLDIVIPGLCGPLPAHAAGFHDAMLDELAEVLGCVHADAESSYIDQLRSCFGLADLPEAGLSLLATTDEFRSHHCMRIEPVHLKADVDHALLIDSSVIGVSPNERTELLRELNGHFEEDGLQLISDESGGWYIVSEQKFGITTSRVDDVIARNVNLFMPAGESAVEWKRFMNEAQMLMYQSDVNRAREESGLMPINSLWLEVDDCGPVESCPAAEAGTYDTVYGDHALHEGLARHVSSDYRQSSELDVESLGTGRVLICRSDLLRAAASGDTDRWLAGLRDVMDDLLRPLMQRSRRRTLDVSVLPCAGKRYRLNRKRLFDIFCRPRADQVICYED